MLSHTPNKTGRKERRKEQTEEGRSSSRGGRTLLPAPSPRNLLPAHSPTCTGFAMRSGPSARQKERNKRSQGRSFVVKFSTKRNHGRNGTSPTTRGTYSLSSAACRGEGPHFPSLAIHGQYDRRRRLVLRNALRHWLLCTPAMCSEVLRSGQSQSTQIA